VRLYETARRKLRRDSRRVYDEEDAAISAFQSVCAGISAGRFPDLQDRDSLWGLLLVITCRKVIRRHRHDRQQQRDVRRTSYDSVFANSTDDSPPPGLQQVATREPSPEFAAAFADTCESLFESLDDDSMIEIVSLRMHGHTDTEIARQLNCSRSTVQRRLEVIRRHLERTQDNG